MNKDLKISFKSLGPKIKQVKNLLITHGPFIAIILILVVYLFVVWRISQLVGAEPPSSDEVTAASVPKVDKKAIDQIQSLAQSNKEIQSFFNSARQNPFSE